MPNVMVHPADDGNTVVANPVFSKVEEALGAVRRRAFELFEKRGRAPGGELDDWLQAEKDLFVVLHAEVSETAKVFRMKILTTGFDAGDLEVIARPQELWVEAKTEKQAELYRQIAAACLTHPRCTAIQTWGFTDKYSWIGSHSKTTQGGALLFDRTYRPKPAYESLRGMLGSQRR